MRFQDRVVVVTGGAAGIGAGCACVFHQEGAKVVVLDRNEAAGSTLVDAFNAQRDDSAILIACDLAQTEGIAGAIGTAFSQWSRLDCLINNVGAHPPATRLEDFSVVQMQQLFAINFFSTYAASQAALPHLRKSQGTIVNISSMTAVLGQHLSTAYAATKGAQVSFTKALALEAGEYGVRVNAVLPSNIDTPLMHEWANTLDDPASALQRVANLQVFKRMGTPEEIGRVCLFLATEESSFLTGQAIEADGGAALDY